jgi:5-methylcytosine-specific restriction protein B
MDTALRRRFDFIEMMPQPGLVTDDLEGVDIRKMLEVMNQRIEALYDREHTLGHAFLMNLKDLNDLHHAFKNKILPLLEEYFYDDWQKIRWVLGASADDFYQRQSFTNLFTDSDAPSDVEKFQRKNIDDLTAVHFKAIY